MASTDDLTTLVCLFHHRDQAAAAINDLRKAGLADSSITLLAGDTSTGSAALTLDTLGIPQRDIHHLAEGLQNGGSIVAVAAAGEYVDKVEHIFGSHKAEKIDETDLDTGYAEPAEITGTTAIPVVEEELLVGKRTVDRGGARVFRRVVEIPVEESIDLRDERINIDRVAVDRPVSDADLAFQSRSIELTETAEEAVVGKSARVVEEVVVGKEVSSHTEHIQDSVRHTEVEVEEVAAVQGRAATHAR